MILLTLFQYTGQSQPETVCPEFMSLTFVHELLLNNNATTVITSSLQLKNLSYFTFKR